MTAQVLYILYSLDIFSQGYFLDFMLSALEFILYRALYKTMYCIVLYCIVLYLGYQSDKQGTNTSSNP